MMEVELITTKKLKELSRKYEFLFVNNIYRFFVSLCISVFIVMCDETLFAAQICCDMNFFARC